MEFYGIEKLSLVDFDGKVSATVFTGACNFYCPFCHNGPLVKDVKSLKTISEDEILTYLKSRDKILEGLCITGGEPTLHKDLITFIEKVKKLNYKVKLDTNGSNPEMVKYLYENNLIDYFAMDIKNSKNFYGITAGIKDELLKKVEKTVDFFLEGNADYEFRTTVIKEYHTKESIKDLTSWIKGAKKYVIQKFKDSGECLEQNLHEIDIKTAKEFLEIAKENIKNSLLRGYD